MCVALSCRTPEMETLPLVGGAWGGAASVGPCSLLLCWTEQAFLFFIL